MDVIITSALDRIVCAGSNEGGVNVFDYPSFRMTMKVHHIYTHYA